MQASDVIDTNTVIVQTEAAVLAAAMRDTGYAETLIMTLTGEDYLRPVHAQIHGMICELYGAGTDPTFLSVQQAAMNARQVAVIDYLVRLVGEAAGLDIVDKAGFEHHVAQVRGQSFRRRLAMVGAGMQDAATLGEAEAAREAARQLLDDVPDQSDAEETSWADLFLRELERAENPTKTRTVPVPFADLAGKLDGGLRAGEIVIVAARPAMGKTVIGAEIARHAALKGTRTLFVSLEMTEAEISARLTAATARVLLAKTKRMVEERDVLDDGDWQRLGKAAQTISAVGQNLTIVEPHAAFTVPSLDRRLTVMARKGDPAGLVVVDYLQLMESVGRASENRQVEVAQMSRGLKLLAKKHGIPIVVLAQLNRGPEQRTDKRPIMADLRESGAIEQDASVIILLHREDAYEPETSRAGEMDLIVAKNRNGATGVVTVSFMGHYALAADMARM